MSQVNPLFSFRLVQTVQDRYHKLADAKKVSYQVFLAELMDTYEGHGDMDNSQMLEKIKIELAYALELQKTAIIVDIMENVEAKKILDARITNKSGIDKKEIERLKVEVDAKDKEIIALKAELLEQKAIAVDKSEVANPHEPKVVKSKKSKKIQCAGQDSLFDMVK